MSGCAVAGPVLAGTMRRRGPRPLMLHLAGPVLEAMQSGVPPAGMADAALLAGIAAYRRHPFERRLAEPPVIWGEGSARLLDYGQDQGAPTVLVVPSLVNRAHVLDLMEGRSLLRFLTAGGLRPLLLDWGWPGPADRRLGLAGHVERVLRAHQAANGDGAMLGYCMGGLLALAAAVLAPRPPRGLALLATPWDFHAEAADEARRLAAMLPVLEPLMVLTGALPVDVLQLAFALPQERARIAAKYRAFGAAPQGGAAAELFVALEDWVNDGVPLAAPVARECLTDWYGSNLPGLGEWGVAGQAIRPASLAMPGLIALPAADRIVPPGSARGLARAWPAASLLEPPLGHVGMVVGSRAPEAVWRPLRDWLGALPGLM